MRRKEHPPTPRQTLFEGKKILCERPSEMPYEVYREARRSQSSLLNVLNAKSPNREIAKLMGIRLGYNSH
jgi:hypothetical protein